MASEGTASAAGQLRSAHQTHLQHRHSLPPAVRKNRQKCESQGRGGEEDGRGGGEGGEADEVDLGVDGEDNVQGKQQVEDVRAAQVADDL